MKRLKVDYDEIFGGASCEIILKGNPVEEMAEENPMPLEEPMEEDTEPPHFEIESQPANTNY